MSRHKKKRAKIKTPVNNRIKKGNNKSRTKKVINVYINKTTEENAKKKGQ